MRHIVLIFFCFVCMAAIYANDRTLTFSQTADLAVAASADLRHSRISQSLMEGAWRWGLRSYFPRISFSVSENDRLQQIGSDSFMKNYGVSIDQLLWDGGRTTMSRNLERIELNLSSARLDRMASEIAESAIAVYRNVLSSRAILEIRKTALGVLEEQRRILNEEVSLGLALPVDLLNADINLADARLGIYSLQLDLAEMERQFAELLGLETLPVLTEKVDIYRSIIFPATVSAAAAAASIARERNPDLAEARYAITKRQAEVKYSSNSWIPSFRLAGSFGLSGQNYPLTRFTWSAGINIEFSNPWIQSRFGAQAGWEASSSAPPPYDRTAVVQNSFAPLPDPASGIKSRQALAALTLEQEKYNIIFERIGRIASNYIEKYSLAEQRRILSLEAISLGEERCRVQEIRLNLGQITRINLMETLMEQTQKEIAAIEAAAVLLEAERELEKFLNLKPGELESFTRAVFTPASQRRN